MTLENGYLLNHRYRILDILGQGGMGAVYRAIDENLDITVAIKENTYHTDESASQFQREARVLAGLRHPNLPRVFDYFVIEQQGQYLVMDFIEGDDLRQWLSRRESISEIDVLQIGIAICNALIYLHDKEPAITHRDIKPGNIKITPDGEVILVDFGLVKVQGEQEVTTTAARAMTPGYSPPEQYGQAPTDHRSDIFSLGATLYAALAGYLPEDSLDRSTGQAELTPLKSYNPGVSPKTAAVILNALAIRLEDRWQSAQAFKQGLIDARESLPPHQRTAEYATLNIKSDLENNGTQPPSTRSSGPLHELRRSIVENKNARDPVWYIFGLMVFFLFMLLGISIAMPEGLQTIFSRSFADTPTPTWSFFEGQIQTRTPLSALVDETQTLISVTEEPIETPDPLINTPSPTPTGGGLGMIAYVSEQSGLPQIWLLNVADGQTEQLTDIIDGACQPDWSPDGERIVMTSPCPSKRKRYPGSKLVIFDIETGEVISLPPSLEGNFDPAWSPDGQWIAYTTLINGQMQLMKIDPVELTQVRLSDGSFDDSSPAWSPDGTQIAFERIRGVSQIWLMDADGENPVQLVRSGIIDNFNPGWFPDGDLILFSQSLGLGSPSRQLFGMRLEDIGTTRAYSVLPRARLDYTPLMDQVDVSPDGLWLAFDFWSFDVLSNIYIMSFPGSNLVQMTDHPGMDYSPAWRPEALD